MFPIWAGQGPFGAISGNFCTPGTYPFSAHETLTTWHMHAYDWPMITSVGFRCARCRKVHTADDLAQVAPVHEGKYVDTIVCEKCHKALVEQDWVPPVGYSIADWMLGRCELEPLGGLRREIPPDIRRAVEARDGRTCRICGTENLAKWHLDHVIQWHKGGPHTVQNLRVTCPRCNLTRSRKSTT